LLFVTVIIVRAIDAIVTDRSHIQRRLIEAVRLFITFSRSKAVVWCVIFRWSRWANRWFTPHILDTLLRAVTELAIATGSVVWRTQTSPGSSTNIVGRTIDVIVALNANIRWDQREAISCFFARPDH